MISNGKEAEEEAEEEERWDGDEVVHASDIAGLKMILEPQLSASDWRGGPADWSRWKALLNSEVTIPKLNPMPAKDAVRTILSNGIICY